ncbi:ABC transporter substrate-binding protein [Nonomuraea jiangxiensis]|uniref:Peptide/nickel transport system substrate-binding protein n=1 Tax=Nonomuraea jiangxiensis TaxID=633440 RepID=A0A1G9N5V3_9ACTN|nr:ABC transporter substrate-binding protein [Nonomuraea jiangxiensis]SDL81774.1 peptide/nickel transport system substrate-binding protein [Nonomuraea jiangxiensis]
MTKKTLALLLTAATLLAGCGSTGASSPGGGAPKAGGTLVLGENGQEPPCLDPHGNASSDGPVATVPVADSLVWFDADGTIEPWLADSWNVSDDGLTYTFKLRHGVKFHDGAVWNAEALKLNFEHMKDPATKSPLAAAYIAPYEDSKVVDEYTLEVRLSSPYKPFLDILSQGYLGMISPKQIKEAPQTICEHPIGSGPFIFDKWTKGQSITYHRNPDYNWGPKGAKHTGPAYLDKLEIRFLAEDATRYNALASGEVDAIDFTPPQNVEDVKANPELGFLSAIRPGHPMSFWLNTSRPPFDDVKVRQALLAAVDRESIIKGVSFGQYDVAQGFVTSSTPGYAAALEGSIAYDPAKAGGLLDEAGWTGRDKDGIRTKDGKRLVAYFPIAANFPAQRMQIAVQTQAAARKIGLDIQLQTPPEQELTDRSNKGDYDMSSGLWATNTADVLWIQYSSENITTDKRRGQNVARLRDAQLDDLLERARQGENPAKLYNQAQARLLELAPAIPFYDDPRPVAYQKKVRDLTFTPAYPSPYFYDTWLEQ